MSTGRDTRNTPNIRQVLAAVSRVTEKRLDAAQQQRLGGLPKLLQDRIQSRIKGLLRVSALKQLDYCSQVNIDPMAFERLVLAEQAAWEAETGQDALVRQLIQGGASLSMLKTLLGINSQTFSDIRKALGMDGTANTSPPMDELGAANLYREWEMIGKPVTVEGFLHLHQTSGQPYRVLWGLVQDWQNAIQQRGTAKRKAKG
ncbi:MAG: STY4526/YPO1902 family pathogenicity island replication protein [Thiothrix sp.]|uniref:STY4526/YPO1902 family pathogenicity island replication protein n=1 Tax=Thiothrix sp. TaxID=1032 RepID=UPI00260E6698|nr:STY4526/YPO1902 family pathogenicity island replication protein [Thiothrix sp.]MDD5395366.1 STY4526/YPO1902 family pathogenicity island replication protein [Thiothrix sp.]